MWEDREWASEMRDRVKYKPPKGGKGPYQGPGKLSNLFLVPVFKNLVCHSVK